MTLPSRTNDTKTTRALSALVNLQPGFFQPDHLKDLGAALISQLSAAPDKSKSTWTGPLLYLRDSLLPNQRTRFEEIISQLLSGPADPAVLVAFLGEIGEGNRSLLLAIPEMRTAIRTQAAYLEKFGAVQAKLHRAEFFESFLASDILDIELFDPTRLWDLSNLVQAFQRATKSGQLTLESIRSRLAKFCADHLLGFLPGRKNLYDEVHKVVAEEPALADSVLGNILARCALSLLETDLETYYPQFCSWKSNLSGEEQAQLLREAVSALQTSDTEWIRALEVITEDVSSAKSPRAVQALAGDLFDHSFAGMKEKGVEALQSALRLLPLLNDRQLRDYVDRNLDVLIANEASGETVDRMESFLQLLESAAARLSDIEIRKASNFCRRLLGPSNDEGKQARALQFISKLNRVELVHELHAELERLSQSENGEIAPSARSILNLLTDGKNPSP